MKILVVGSGGRVYVPYFPPMISLSTVRASLYL